MSPRSFALACLLATLIVGGTALDKALAGPSPTYCAAQKVVGCPAIDCVQVDGNCPKPPNAPYDHIFQQGIPYTPCTAPSGPLCPVPPIYRASCYSAGCTPTATDPRGVIVCDNTSVSPGC